jgi:hypothetical protein
MASELKIRWDGDVPGMAEHRLSLGGFGDALALLVLALRRIATQMVSTAVEGEHPKTGRFASIARQLDIEIVSIEGQSTGFNAVVSFAQPPEELPLFADIPERATFELLDSIERESRGQAANWAVRRYLGALPTGVRRQWYDFAANGHAKHIEIGDIHLAEMPGEPPSLRQYEGNIIGVGFEPGRSEVRIRTELATPILDATNEQVEMALAIRKAKIRVLGVNDGKRTRLLTIADAHAPQFQRTPASIEEHIFKRWNGLFERLAK